jgi:hypothetical protein
MAELVVGTGSFGVVFQVRDSFQIMSPLNVEYIYILLILLTLAVCINSG